MPHTKRLISCPDMKEDAVSSILLIGDLGLQLQSLASRLLEIADQQNVYLKVHTSNELPITAEERDLSLTVSLIVLLVNLNGKNTMMSCQRSAKFIPLPFYLGRLILVGLNIACEEKWSVGPEEVSDFSSQCDCPVIWGNLSNEESLNSLCQQLLHLLKQLSVELCVTSLCSGSSSMLDTINS